MRKRCFYYDYNDPVLPVLFRRGTTGYWMGVETQRFDWTTPGSGTKAEMGAYAPSCRLEATLIVGFEEP